ncbi:MAG: GTPase HflX [Proteobacteria bacterium]|uniref:ribosome rescue GTPase HflX n=1 Tax=Thauera sp. 2A1 TaxID=2570191 RepID=UPI001291736D|nr:ribosome rescue GTPase HflX [Thauera sp. 2A1]KAI5916375.1 GTPase HflX [Thauera sp. 2A1]MBS0511306.1 GTPase HflX [Pseudomonadota bacterium]MBS0553685.1 GTPase HflX [Pseudomonadota bacterium]
MFERPANGERAVLVQLDLGQDAIEERLSELKLLATSAGASIEAVVQGRRAAPDPKLFAGSGKVQEIGEALRAHGADIVIFNHALSPAQQRNLERELQCMVIDRTALILDIFAQRARSHEGKLQVELAQLQHLATRLVRGWTHLERQKGGIGLRGPGEKQLETDRRLLGNRVKLLKSRLAQIEKQRKVRRRARERRDVLSVSLVGYTNAGKSTLFNALTKAGAYAADQLFATLDTTSRRLFVDGENVVLSDTVGFIRDLPHALVAAFQATLEETAEADLLLHVVDSASEDRDAQIQAVNEVLAEIGAADVPQILVWNKIDLTHARPAVERGDCDKLRRVFLSARTGEGLDLLRSVLAEVARAAKSEDAGRMSAPSDDGISVQT